MKYLRKIIILLFIIFISNTSFAANITFLESGTDSTEDITTFYSATTGTVASATDQFYTGPRSIKFSTGAGPSAASATTIGGILSDTGRRISFRFRMGTLSASGTGALLFSVQTSGGSAIFTIAQSQASGNTLRLTTGASNTFGTTALSAATWYRVTVSYVITNTTTHQIKVYINGNSEITETNTGTLGATSSNKMQIGPSSGQALWGTNRDIWFDDIYVDDGSDLSDPGDIRVTSKRPNANGTTNGFTTQIGSGGSGYGTGHSPQVNEQPLSQTNGWSMIGAGSAVTEEYNIESKATGDVNINNRVVIGVMGWVFAKSALSETGNIVVSGTSTNISLTSTATLFIQSSATPTVFPPGTGTDIGIITSTTVTTVSLYECGILVAYRDPLSLMFLTIVPRR